MPEIRWLDTLQDIPAAHWDALHDGTNPFVHHAFLCGLEQHGCLRPDWGWIPRYLTLWRGGTLVGAAPGYLKDNSHGEFVFDHAWANAYARYGQAYYPKWIGAVPYSPVSGPRLLAADQDIRAGLLEAMVEATVAGGRSSAHVNFHTEQDDAAFADSDWLQRLDVQYHWRNPGGWRTFEDYLGAMDHRHRKNIRQERARVARAGIHFRRLHGDEAGEADLAAMHGFYLQTFLEYGNAPALSLDFLRHLAREMPRNLLLILACHEDRPVAGALCLRGGQTLYGRYWGASAALPSLHFETCYYQGIDYCLQEGLQRFEPGAQGEHKIARGFLPTLVRSRHWIADPTFRDALAHWCGEEVAATHRHAQILAARSPFRETQA